MLDVIMMTTIAMIAGAGLLAVLTTLRLLVRMAGKSPAIHWAFWIAPIASIITLTACGWLIFGMTQTWACSS